MIRVTVEEISEDCKSQRFVCCFEIGKNGRQLVSPGAADLPIMYTAMNGLIYETAECQKPKTAEKEGIVGRTVGQEDATTKAQESHPEDEPCARQTTTGIPEAEARVEKGPYQPDLQGLSSPFNGTPPLPGPNRPFTL